MMQILPTSLVLSRYRFSKHERSLEKLATKLHNIQIRKWGNADSALTFSEEYVYIAILPYFYCELVLNAICY